jgi:hypothetical protein
MWLNCFDLYLLALTKLKKMASDPTGHLVRSMVAFPIEVSSYDFSTSIQHWLHGWRHCNLHN